ncbi:Glycosyltransferase involved in cell wall bisynthesis [Draconibacterium orientale]|uniref:Glycosyl transferase n=1 Tax=Draconibacterium orientale TaxID=1168034 RepID=X5DJM0_9BACT|nr:glycosyltransferase family 4 protein [Draconibacterium orientale]AHW61319.1 glycosyl transferase [Draconibacterium orientale]SEU05663.1 Glycosyltransferase involved in cell wall bisynthesis [Draconibacterium orientale]
MRIVISINTAWNIYNFRLGLIKVLLADGHEVYAVSPQDKYVKKLETHGIKHFKVNINHKGTNPFEDIKLVKAYKRIFLKIQPDIILSYTIKPNIYGNLAAQKVGVPVINNVSGLGTLFIKNSFASIVGKFLYHYSFKNSNWVFFQNNTDKELFIQAKLVKGDKVSVLPGSGVNTQKFSIKRKSNSGKRFLFVGRLLKDKGIIEYLKASQNLSKKYPNVNFTMVGELGYANKTAITEIELKNWVKNKQIKYLGKQDDMVKVLAETDVMVLPSYREGLSKSLIEAAAMNLPIVTTDVPGCREVVEHGTNGFLCQVKNADDLQNKMETMINLSQEERLKMGEEGRRIAENKYSEEIVIKLYKDKINELIS